MKILADIALEYEISQETSSAQSNLASTPTQVPNIYDSSLQSPDRIYSFISKSEEGFSTEAFHPHFAPTQIFQLKASIIRGIDDKVVGVCEVVKDITEQIQAEELLADDEFRYSQLFQNSKDAIFLHDNVGTIIECNKRAIELFKFEEANPIGFNIFDLTTHPWIDTLETPSQEGYFEGDATFMKRDGTAFVGEYTSTLIDLSHRTFFQTLIKDISERKMFEEEAMRSQKLESIALLAGGIAHDFNNLLSSIIGHISLALMEAQEGSEIHTLLTDAEKVTTRATNLTKQLLSFSKGGLPSLKTINLKALVEETVKFSLRGTNISLHLDLEKQDFLVNVDENQISQVINNMVINASHAMPTGGRLTVRVYCAARLVRNFGDVGAKLLSINPHVPGKMHHGVKYKFLPCNSLSREEMEKGIGDRYVAISITDTGHGIPKENLTKIFDPYFTTKKDGSGLGLATSYSTIRNHQGVIFVDSQESVGTCFTIYLPLTNNSPENPLEKGAALKNEFISTGKILILDDENEIRKVLGKLLEKLGFEVASFGTGEALLEYLSHSTDLIAGIFLDMTIPGGKGAKEIIGNLREFNRSSQKSPRSSIS